VGYPEAGHNMLSIGPPQITIGLPLTRQRGEGRSRFWGKPLSILASLGKGQPPPRAPAAFARHNPRVGSLRQGRSGRMADLILRGGRTVDPANARDEVADIAFSGGKVAADGAALGRDGASVVAVRGPDGAPGSTA